MKKKKYYILIIILILVVGISFGYAKLQATLSIDATVNVSAVRWNIECKNVIVNEESFTNDDTNYVRIDPLNPNKISYNITLNNPGDFYEFTFKIVNDGTIDGKLNNIVSTGTTDESIIDIGYIDYNIEGLPSNGSILKSNSNKLVKVRIDYLPGLGGESSFNINKSYEFNYIKK